MRLRYSLASNRPSQTAHHALSRIQIMDTVRNKFPKEWYYTVDSTIPNEMISKSPTYSIHPKTYSNAKLQEIEALVNGGCNYNGPKAA